MNAFFGSLKGLLKSNKKLNISVKVIILGLDNAGKTSILKSLAKEDIKIVNPTKGFNVKIISIENVTFSVWDLGGQVTIRNVWENYIKENEGLIFVIDSSDQYRLEESGFELRDMLEVNKYIIKKEELSGLPLLILTNKQDLKCCMDVKGNCFYFRT